MESASDSIPSGTTLPRRGVSASESAAIMVAALLGEYSLLIMPFIITAMMQSYGLDESSAGNLISVQLVSMGIAGILVSYLLRHVPARRIVIGAAVFIAGANALCAIGAGAPTLLVGRCLSGLGEGSMMAAAGAIAAGVSNAHRLFSLLGLAIAGVAAAALILTPFLFEILGPRGVFWLLACSPLAALAAARWLPDKVAAGADVPKLGAFKVRGATPVLASFALLWVGASALWVFAELIGAAHGLSLGQVGSYLAAGQVAGIVGPLAAARFGEQLGLRASIAGGSAVMAAAGLVMVYGSGAACYAGGAAFLSIAVMFLAPCFRSLMARLDATGSVVAMSVAFYTFGFGLAPALVAVVHAAGSGYGDVALLATAAFVASGLLVVLTDSQQ
jgi:predicted MFS family arabinose efflux permease